MVESAASTLPRIRPWLSLRDASFLVGSDSYICASNQWLRPSTKIWTQFTISRDFEQI